MQLTIDVGVFEHFCWQIVDTLTRYYDNIKYPRNHMIRKSFVFVKDNTIISNV